jgi:hypothetical protein
MHPDYTVCSAGVLLFHSPPGDMPAASPGGKLGPRIGVSLLNKGGWRPKLDCSLIHVEFIACTDWIAYRNTVTLASSGQPYRETTIPQLRMKTVGNGITI